MRNLYILGDSTASGQARAAERWETLKPTFEDTLPASTSLGYTFDARNPNDVLRLNLNLLDRRTVTGFAERRTMQTSHSNSSTWLRDSLVGLGTTKDDDPRFQLHPLESAGLVLSLIGSCHNA